MRFRVALVFVGCVAVSAVAARAQGLSRAIDAAEALGARTGVVVCGSDGGVLFQRRATEGFAPASNMKVLTAAAVVGGLGADFEFTTAFRLRAGRLVVGASGDPNWIHDTPHAAGTVMAAVAAALKRLGVRTLAGVELDAGTFTGPARPATWPQDQLQTYYCAPTGPFVLEQGTFALHIEAKGGDNAAVQVVAPVDAAVRGAIELVDKKQDAVYGATDQGDGVRVRGKFPRRGSPVTIRTAVADPQSWYRAALDKALADAGIAVAAVAEPALADQLVFEHKSKLDLALLRMLEDSSNFDAEQCLRVLGDRVRHDGSLAGGVEALHGEVKKLVGTVPAEAVFVDGSGLSKQNRVTPGLLAVALVRSHGTAAGQVLRACLPVAGQSGTLENRFTGSDLVGRVRAKTGWIRGASALSGLLDRKDGSVRYFAILMNYDPKKDGLNKDLKKLQEDIVRAIDGGDLR